MMPRMRAKMISSSSDIVNLVILLVITASVPVESVDYYLKAATGQFSTPNHPSNYPDNRNDNWYIDLQKFEHLELISATASPSFETCCDYFKVMVNGVYKFELKNTSSPVGSTWWSIDGPARITLAFNSDSSVTGRGMKGTYRVTCQMEEVPNKTPKATVPKICKHCTCKINRSASQVSPVTWTCLPGYSGADCSKDKERSQLFQLSDWSGAIRTPHYPDQYGDDRDVTWNLDLWDHMEVVFSRDTDSVPDFESCCDVFDLHVGSKRVFQFGSAPTGVTGSELTRVRADGGTPKSIVVKFASDHAITGKGYAIRYEVKLLPAYCLNRGILPQGFKLTSIAAPVTCQCPKDFSGLRCQTPSVYLEKTVDLFEANGIIATPGYPDPYPSAQNITWRFDLRPFEVITFSGDVQHGIEPGFEECCDFFNLYLNNTLVENLANTRAGMNASRQGQGQCDAREQTSSSSVSSLGHPTTVRLQFFSDGRVTGHGLRLNYSISCAELRKNQKENACINGGICSVSRTTDTSGPVHCQCPKAFSGPRCEHPVLHTSETKTVIGPHGIIETPNYPGPYPNALTKTWKWMLQPFESISFTPLMGNESSGSHNVPDFEQCCDSMKLFSAGNLVSVLSAGHGFSQPIDLTGHHQPLEVEMVFSSDGAISGNGTQLRYSISCLDRDDEGPSACLNGGTCSLSRNESTLTVGSVTCHCPKNFHGPRCERRIQKVAEHLVLTAETGYIKTPNYPQPYPHLTTIVWTLNLQQFETLTFEQTERNPPDFEDCCDFFTFEVIHEAEGSFDLRQATGAPGTVLHKFLSNGGPTKVQVVFNSDGGINGNGFRIRYHIGCSAGSGTDFDNACLNGGLCSISRNVSSGDVGPVKCSCPRGFTGTRCEIPVPLLKELFILNEASGVITIPDVSSGSSQLINNARDITWEWNLQRHEFITIHHNGNSSHEEHEGSRSLNLFVNGSHHQTLEESNETIRVMASVASTQIKLRFVSEGKDSQGTGTEVRYSIGCMDESMDKENPACFHGGSCSVARHGTNVETFEVVSSDGTIPGSRLHSTCRYGGTCSSASDESHTAVGSVVCHCPKNFHGPRCEQRIQKAEEHLVLSAETGYIETPNYPQPYPHLTTVVWTLNLQQFETLTFEQTERNPPDFEDCCDFFTFEIISKAEGSFDFRQATGAPGTQLYKFSSAQGPTQVQVVFSSDGGINGNGFKVRYHIGCSAGSETDSDDACLNGGICSVSRNASSGAVGPVKCACQKGFTGARCQISIPLSQELVILNEASGVITLPDGSFEPTQSINKARDISWVWNLQRHEFITIPHSRNSAPWEYRAFMHLNLYINGSHYQTVEANHKTIRVMAPDGPTEVKLRFTNDGTVWQGPGSEVIYSIGCLDENTDRENPACLHGGSCSVVRNGTHVGPVSCSCPMKGFYGERCEHQVVTHVHSVNLVSPSGTSGTPGFPEKYPNGVSVTWRLQLQAFETVTFTTSGQGKSSFEDCCDSFLMLVNGEVRADFGLHSGERNEVLAAVTAGPNEPAEVELKFHSDGGINGVGLQVDYKITCSSKELGDDHQHNPCLNGGTCMLSRSHGHVAPVSCHCPDDYTGPRCEKLVHECPLDCGHSNGAACLWNNGHFTCSCPPGFAHNGLGCEDIDECNTSHHPNPCESPKQCVNLVGSFRCTCPRDLGFQELLEKNGKTECIHSGCANPWISDGKQAGCYLFPDQFRAGDGSAAAAFCTAQHDGSVANIPDETENRAIGMSARTPLVWIGLSDMESERSWKWSNAGSGSLQRMKYRNWGPGFPSGAGDFAVLYPNSPDFGDCKEAKRFICQTEDPFCPTEWIKPSTSDTNVGKYCFFQSNYQLDFKSAERMCSSMAFRGNLVKWDPDTALRLGPDFWNNDPADGLAHFWVLGTSSSCGRGTRGTSGTQDQEPRPEPAGSDTCQVTAKPGSCSFVYPNRWADYSAKDAGQEHFPSVVCRKSTTYKMKPLNETEVNPLGMDEESSTTRSPISEHEVKPTPAVWVVTKYPPRHVPPHHQSGHDPTLGHHPAEVDLGEDELFHEGDEGGSGFYDH